VVTALPDYGNLKALWIVEDSGTIWGVGDGGVIESLTPGAKDSKTSPTLSEFLPMGWLQHDSGTKANLRSVCFFDDKIGWVAGASGRILKTIDGGKNWNTERSGVNSDLYSIYFLDRNVGWVVGANGTVLKSVDGGESWTRQIQTQSDGTTSVYFVNADLGFKVREDSKILRTKNGGATWEYLTLGVSEPLRAVFFVDAKTGWLAGDKGTLAATEDGGDSWNLQTFNRKTDLRFIRFVDKKAGWIVDSEHEISRTTDGGATWDPPQKEERSLGDLYFSSPSTGYIFGDDGGLLSLTVSSSLNADWIILPSTKNPPASALCAFFVDRDNGWIAGSEYWQSNTKTIQNRERHNARGTANRFVDSSGFGDRQL